MTTKKAKRAAAKALRMRAESGVFVINGAYLRKQAEEAVKTFVAPVSGAARAFRTAGEPMDMKVTERA